MKTKSVAELVPHDGGFESETHRLRAAQIWQLYSQSRVGLIGALLGALILVATLWNVVSHLILVAWLVSYALVQVARHGLISAFHRTSPAGEATFRWGVWFAVGTFLSALLWGLAGVFLYPENSPLHQLVLSIFLAGITSAAAVVYSPTTECYLPTILAGMLPLAARHIYDWDGAHLITGGVIVLFTIVLALTARWMHGSVVESLRLRFEKDKLVESLQEARGDLEMRVEERSAELKMTNEKLVAEIAERLRTEKSLRESENRFRSLIEEAPVGICFARNLTTVYANPKYHEMFGFSGVDELVGSPITERIAPQCLSEFADRARRREEGLYAETEYEAVGLRKDGSQFPVQAAVTRVHLIDGPCSAGFFLDVTERKRTEDALRESEAKFRSLVEQIPAIVYVAALDRASTTLYVSQQVETLVGFSRADYMADPDIWRNRLHSEDRERVMSELNKSHESGEPFISEYRMITKDGQTVWFLDQARLVHDETGQPLCLQGVMTDITERKRAEESLRHTEQMLRSILSTSPVGIVLTQDRRIKWANDAWVDLFGFANEHDYVDQPTSIMHPSQENYQHYRKTLYDNMKPGKVSEADAKLARKDCTLFDAHIRINLLEPSDPSKGTISAIADISERKKAEEALQESEEKYRTVLENMQDVFYRTDMEGNVTLVSPSGPQMLGYESVDEMIGLNVAKIFYKNREDRDRSLSILRERGKVSNYGLELVRKDGRSIIVSTNSHICRDKSGNPLGTEGVLTDITERKRAEDALRESEEKYRILVEKAHEGILVTQDAVIKFLNPRAAEILGYTEQELISKAIAETIHPDDREMVLQTHFRRLGGEEFPSSYPFRILTKAGNSGWVEIDVASIQWQGRPAALTLMTEVTERKQMEEALKESEECYRSIVENSFDGIFVQKGPEIIFANSRLYEMLGYPEGELEGIDHWLIYHPDYQEITRERAKARMRGEEVESQYEVRLKRKDGSFLEGEIIAIGVTVKGEIGVQVWVRDISKRKRMEEVQKRLATAIEQAGEAIVITDRRGNVEYANPAHERITGYTREEVIGSLPPLFEEYELDSELRRELYSSMTKGVAWSGRKTGRRKDGTICEMDATVTPIRDPNGRIVSLVGVERDVTHEVLLQKQLLQAQKMEAIGTLAGGIAHDFNNLLTVVQGFSELLLAEKEQDDPEYADLQKIFHAASNGAELVQRLLMFSRKSESKPVPMDLNKKIVQVEKLLRRTIPRMVDIILELSADLPRTNADPSQIEQILMNLAVNARDAMPDVGKLTLKTSIVTLDEEYCRLHVEASPGEYVVLEVSDTGHGMHQQTVEHIFEPFFTTKEMGRGTGLGLAMVYGIVKQHNGHMTVYSEVGQGTTFQVYLPAIPGEEETGVETQEEVPAFGAETVLLVDDEEFVRELGARILTKHGYTVLQAVNGREGLDLFKKERSRISLVILDLIMPEMGGMECLKELLKIDPRVNVLVASGYSADASVKQTIQMGARSFVTKPFRVKELLRDVRQVLDRS